MSIPEKNRRENPRYDLIECGVLWRPTDGVPERLGVVFITNASLNGVQFRTREPIEEEGELLLQLGTAEGVVYIPGQMRYFSKRGTSATFGFRFNPQTRRDRDALGKYILGLKERVCGAG